MLVTYEHACLRTRTLNDDGLHTFTELGEVAVIVVVKEGVDAASFPFLSLSGSPFWILTSTLQHSTIIARPDPVRPIYLTPGIYIRDR